MVNADSVAIPIRLDHGLKSDIPLQSHLTINRSTAGYSRHDWQTFIAGFVDGLNSKEIIIL
jgi:hypothetical protein